ncbi:hypothetical protein PF005_g29455 [Phytophthora fragariae]|uniref:Uncharacterized protein n=1 Tax=Phytophthora fragariae TaxID=53985 RepID=A0A6A3VPV6_9STRA|nr:hypothetical protein PF005_g29455 [Phytophthora fragariae]KAE9171224.1 hypothetical protein PF002_g29877 [Phytophthora fragariae]
MASEVRLGPPTWACSSIAGIATRREAHPSEAACSGGITDAVEKVVRDFQFANDSNYPGSYSMRMVSQAFLFCSAVGFFFHAEQHMSASAALLHGPEASWVAHIRR